MDHNYENLFARASSVDSPLVIWRCDNNTIETTLYIEIMIPLGLRNRKFVLLIFPVVDISHDAPGRTMKICLHVLVLLTLRLSYGVVITIQ